MIGLLSTGINPHAYPLALTYCGRGCLNAEVSRNSKPQPTRTTSASRSWSIRITPTGESLLDCHVRLARRGGVLIVDEAFADFDAEAESLAPSPPSTRAVVLRSFGKT
jgi:hypothetical protein